MFLLGAFTVALVAYSIARMVASFRSGHDAYHIVTLSLGERIGRGTGLILFGAYLCFALATPSAGTAFLADLCGIKTLSRVAWGSCAGAMTIAALLVLRLRGTSVARALLIIEGGGIALLVLLACAILFGHGQGDGPVAAPPGGVGGGLMSALVVAFLSWAGFESCLSLTSDTRNPQVDIPRSLYATVALTAVLFVGMFWVIERGFAERLGGARALVNTPDTLSALGVSYLGPWSARAFGIAALASSFAGLVAPMTAATHLLSSLIPARRHGLALPIVGGVVLCGQVLIPWVLGPRLPPVLAYGLLASCGAICIMVVYQIVQLGFARALIDGRLLGSPAELVVPLAALIIMTAALVTTFQAGGSAETTALLGVAWSGVALGLGAVLPSRHTATSSSP
ncbi:aminoacid permease [Ameyamaea chiangmaiensis NBRC 103196]|nr:aminoacid permease [Ameyamaea chiangmaiensis NBRC 103196]